MKVKEPAPKRPALFLESEPQDLPAVIEEFLQ
jgi:hypothetical protein